MTGDRRVNAAGIATRLVGLATIPVLAVVLLAFIGDYGHYYLPWSAPRLAASLGMLHGYPLYSPVDEGVINGWIYGPIPALLWLPAGLGATPAAALRIAAAIDFAILFAPIWLIARRESAVGNAFTTATAFSVSAAAIFALFHPTLEYMATELCSDVPAVAFAALSCVCLTSQRQPSQSVLAAAFFALAIWSKLLVLPVAAAQFAFIALTSGTKPALRYSVILAAWTTALGVAFVVVWGVEPIVFNMWRVPFGHLLASGGIDYLREFGRFFLLTAPLWILIVFARLKDEKRRFPRATDTTALLVMASLFSLPGCIVASLKIGGDSNSLHSVYFVLTAATGVLARLVSTQKIARVALPAVVALSAIPIGISAYGRLSTYVTGSFIDRNEAAFEMARAAPGRYYFPFDPLANLMAEGRMFHFDDGVYSRYLANLPPTWKQIESGLPSERRTIVYPREAPRHLTRLAYAEFNKSEQWPWIVFTPPAIPAGNTGTGVSNAQPDSTEGEPSGRNAHDTDVSNGSRP